MSVIIFFGYSILTLLVGFVIVGLTFHHWWKESQKKSQSDSQSN